MFVHFVICDTGTNISSLEANIAARCNKNCARFVWSEADAKDFHLCL